MREIIVLGRRGPAQAAFTNPEVRELGELLDADIVIDPAEMELDDASKAYVDSEDCDPTNRRNVEYFTAFSARDAGGQDQARRAALPAHRRSRSRATARSSRS